MARNAFKKYLINEESSIRDAILRLYDSKVSILICHDRNDNVTGVFSEGDFRRAVHKKIELNSSLKEVFNKSFYFIEDINDLEKLDNILQKENIELIPVLKNKKLKDIIHTEKYRKDKSSKNSSALTEHPLLIMAGGKGTRLDPFTRILPKPLMPIKDDPIIKLIINKFLSYGVNKVFISLNEKAEMIKGYFSSQEMGCELSFLTEEKPLGTAGSLSLLGNIENHLFMTNCDIIIDTDYSKILEFHKVNKNILTLVSSAVEYNIPYGICEIKEGGELSKLVERPKLDYLVNTGLYLLSPEAISLVPSNKRMDMPDLIELLVSKKKKIGVYPVSEKSWQDIGQWSEYKKTVSSFDI